MPRIAIVPSQYSVTSWKRRQSRPAGCSILYDLTSGMLPRPLMMRISCNSCCSFTELAVGLTEVSELRCCAPAGGANATHARRRHRMMQDREAEAPPANRMRERNLVVMFVPSPTLLPASAGEGKLRPVAKSKRLFRGGALGLDSLAVSRHPTPGARSVAALGDALLVDVRDLLAVAGEQ